MKSSWLCLYNAGIKVQVHCSYLVFSLHINLQCPLYWFMRVFFVEAFKLCDVTILHIQGVVETLLILPTPQCTIRITLCGQRGASPAWVRVWLCGRKCSSVDPTSSHRQQHFHVVSVNKWATELTFPVQAQSMIPTILQMCTKSSPPVIPIP